MISNSSPGYVFLTECQDFSQAQIIKSFLESQGFHPRVRDEQTRAIAPHLGQFLGRLIIDIPEIEFMAASHSLESREQAPTLNEVSPSYEIEFSQALAKKALWNAILGCLVMPVICNLYSMILGVRVLRMERPLSPLSRKRLLWAIGFNSFAFYFWLTLAPHFIFSLR